MKMHVAISGSNGLIGAAAARSLAAEGFTVSRLVRGSPVARTSIRWDPEHGVTDLARLEGIDGVVHLAGQSLASGRWTAQRKAEIRQSRVEGTARLSESLAMLPRPPRVLVCASAIGIYGNRGQEILSEDSPLGHDFLATLCREWEAASEISAKAGVRVVHLRFGVVLSPAGGALTKMLLPFRLGVGGRVGDGRQFMSWIAVDDAAGAVHHALITDSLEGPVNAVAPAPVTNAEFARTLARVLHRPALVPMPALVARLAFGEIADALLLASQRVAPTRLQASGFRFRHPELESALRSLLDLRHVKNDPVARGSKVWQ